MMPPNIPDRGPSDPEPTWRERRDGIHNHPCWRCQAGVRCADTYVSDGEPGGALCHTAAAEGGCWPECEACADTSWCGHCNVNEGIWTLADGVRVCPACLEEEDE